MLVNIPVAMLNEQLGECPSDSGLLKISNAGEVIVEYHFAPPEILVEELEWFLPRYVRGKRSILEIGSGNGGMLAHLAVNADKGARVRAISLPRRDDELNELAAGVIQLRLMGHDVDWLNADSRSPEAISWASESGPYDLVFIDGNHYDEYVRADWRNYGPLGQIVAFHDINDDLFDVRVLWAELKADGYITDELTIYPQTRGLGVIVR